MRFEDFFLGEILDEILGFETQNPKCEKKGLVLSTPAQDISEL